MGLDDDVRTQPKPSADDGGSDDKSNGEQDGMPDLRAKYDDDSSDDEYDDSKDESDDDDERMPVLRDRYEDDSSDDETDEENEPEDGEEEVETPMGRGHRVKTRRTFYGERNTKKGEGVSCPQIESIKWECDAVRMKEVHLGAGYKTKQGVINVEFNEH